MQWMCCLWLAGSFLFLFVVASLDFKKTSATTNKCEQINCYQGSCLNGTCLCRPGWTGQYCESCNGRIRLNGSNGFIVDGPFNYSKDVRCTWLLDGRGGGNGESVLNNVSSNGVLTLTIDHFATECGWDHLYIYDGDGVYSKQLAALSGDLTHATDSASRQYVAETGRAYVFFYSDLAYNMSGFNVSFRWEQCPKNCSGRGECLSNGTCSCQTNWTGDYCERPSCSATCVNGKCGPGGDGSDVCECSQGFRGPYCNISSENEAWYSLNTDGPGARASHAVAVVDGEMYVIGGYHFVGAVSYTFMSRYKFSSNSWTSVNVKNGSFMPSPRYDHTLIYSKEQNKLIMFGGVIEQRNITDEMWSFDRTSMMWSLITPSSSSSSSAWQHSTTTSTSAAPDLFPRKQLQQATKQSPSSSRLTPNSITPPLAVAGHTAHLIRCNQVPHGGDKMVVIHGYNPYFGYVNYVQEYFFGNNSWLLATTTGANVNGAYGHSSVYDEQTRQIYVYGGIFATTPINGQPTDRLHTYDPCMRVWKFYQGSGFESYLHSAVILSRTMIIVGGNAHNESNTNKPTDCYSGTVLAYDIECAIWRVLDTPDYLPSRLARYGHRGVGLKDSMYIYGGFNGRLNDDVLRFVPATCATYRDKDSCVNSQRGSKCYWVEKAGMCGSFAEATAKIAVEKLDQNRMEKSCQHSGVGGPFDCARMRDCTTCVSNGMRPCQWCSGQCRSDCTSSLAVPTEVAITIEDGCPKRETTCTSWYTCSACKVHEDKCVWGRMKNQYNVCIDKIVDSRTSPAESFNPEKLPFDATAVMPSAQLLKDSVNVCPLPCALLMDCESCASSGCMWCSPLERCVDMNAYQSSFPYGQCLQWSTSDAQCQQETAPCSKYLTCASCHAAGPRCGWCDDGSNTGLGTCMEGGNDGPVVETDDDRELYTTAYSKCRSDRWYFFDCPACQCNGHSKCVSPSETVTDQTQQLPCVSCHNDTTGEHCDKCRDGYYGNSLNGGSCSPCECNSQATSCNSLTGKCYCTTKGVSGHTCDKCDQKYIGDPRNQTCYYELTVDFVFTFNLNSEDDMYITKINFVTRPPKENTDVTFKLTCAQAASFVGKVNLSVGQVESDGVWKYRRFLAGTACHEIERRFSAEEFQFGTSANTTFLVMLYDFQTPISITVSFAQTPTIDWMKFFVTFALCFFILLVIAFALWKIKQRVDVYRRRQRMFVEMAQMASRPFASLQLELSTAASARRQYATPIAIEPCVNYRAAVLTIAVRMPTGGRKYAPNGQSGVALASSLCQITPGQLAQLQTPPSPVPEQKSKRRRPACMS